MPAVLASSQDVTFQASFTGNNSWFKGNFTASIDMPDNTADMNGGNPLVNPSLAKTNMTATLTIPGCNGSVQVEFDPLITQSVALPTLNLVVPIQGATSYYMNVSGSIVADLTAENNVSLSSSAISWPSNGSATLITPSNVQDGSRLNVTLTNVRYELYAGVFARGAANNQTFEQSVVNYTKLGTVQASPNSVSGSFTFVNSSSSNIGLWIGVIVLAAACGTMGFMFFRTRQELKRLTKAPATPAPKAATAAPPPPPAPIPAVAPATAQAVAATNVCKNCGSSNAPGAKFCRKCGKKL